MMAHILCHLLEQKTGSLNSENVVVEPGKGKGRKNEFMIKNSQTITHACKSIYR